MGAAKAKLTFHLGMNVYMVFKDSCCICDHFVQRVTVCTAPFERITGLTRTSLSAALRQMYFFSTSHNYPLLRAEN